MLEKFQWKKTEPMSSALPIRCAWQGLSKKVNSWVMMVFRHLTSDSANLKLQPRESQISRNCRYKYQKTNIL